MSERKEQAIYDAVHEAIMCLRIPVIQRMRSIGYTPDELDTRIAQAGHAAGMAAVSAYRTSSQRKKAR